LNRVTLRAHRLRVSFASPVSFTSRAVSLLAGFCWCYLLAGFCWSYSCCLLLCATWWPANSAAAPDAYPAAATGTVLVSCMVLYACVLLNCLLGGAAGGLWLKGDAGLLEGDHDRLGRRPTPAGLANWDHILIF